jgi:hypothetical protein
VLAVHANDPLQGSQTPPPKPAMVLVPDKSSDTVLDEINQRRQTALRDKMKYEADYGRCLKKSPSKEEALTCLARWEAAASEYHKAEIEFARRSSAGTSTRSTSSTSNCPLTSRLARLKRGSAVCQPKTGRRLSRLAGSPEG